MWKFIFISSIDICQFSITSLFNSGDDRHRSISFRSVILIMVYAGTIILNLLAASVDNKFPVASNQSAENSTMPSVMEPAEKDNSVLVAPLSVSQITNLFITASSRFRTTRRWSTCGTLFLSLGALAQSSDGLWCLQ